MASVALLAGAPAFARAQQPTRVPDVVRDDPRRARATERVVFQLVLPDVGTSVVEALQRDGDVWLPVGPMLDLAGLPHTAERGGQRFSATPGAPRVVRAGDGAVASAGDTLWVPRDSIAQWLRVRTELSWAALTVTLRDAEALPAMQRAHRAATRVVTGLPQRAIVPRAPSDLPRPVLDGLVLDYAAITPLGAAAGGTSLSLSGGANLLGGALDGVLETDGAGGAVGRGSWTLVWDQPALRQLRVGDVPLTGPLPWSVRGIAIGNAPFIRPLAYGAVPYGVRLGPGWEVESYVGGQLVAVDSTGADGRFTRRFPVEYGSNPVELVGYGPLGEVRRFSRLFQVFPDEFLPSGDFEYGVSGGRCTDARCTVVGNADARWGATPYVSVRAGTMWLGTDSTGTEGRPYAQLSAIVGNTWSMQLAGVLNTRASAAVRWQPSPDRSVGFDASAARDDWWTRLQYGAASPRQVGVNGFMRPGGPLSRSFVTFDLRHSDETRGGVDVATFGGGTTLAGVQLLPSVTMTRDPQLLGGAPRWSGYVAAFAMAPRSLGPVLGQPFAFASVERTAYGATATSVTVTRGELLGGRLRVEVGGRWSGVAPTYTLRLLTDLPQARAITSVQSQGGDTRGSQFVQGSVFADPSRGTASFVAGPVLQRGGVTGRVFLDRDANGVFGPGDTPLGGVLVRVGTEYALTDASGHYRVWDVAPFHPVEVVVDPGTLDSPLWVTDARRTVIVPWPNRFQAFDVPIAAGGIVEGTVWDAMRQADATGVRVMLRSDDGQATRFETTFTDGAFMFLGVPPGRWIATVVPDDVLRSGNAASTAVPVTVRVREEGDRVPGVDLVLVSRPR